jgi:DNA-binding CsgD family transcriptional regulator
MNLDNHFWQECFTQLPVYAGLLDLDSRFLVMNNETKKLCFGTTDVNILGLGNQDIQGKASQLTSLFHEQDQLVLSGKTIHTLDVSSWANNRRGILVGVKKPYYQKNLIKGIIIAGNMLDSAFIRGVNFIFDPTYNKKLIGSRDVSYSVNSNIRNFSEKAQEVLFFLLRGLSNREIASLMNRSARTVEKYIDELKVSFGVSKKSQIFSAALNAGYAFDIPKSIFQKNCTVILSESIV